VLLAGMLAAVPFSSLLAGQDAPAARVQIVDYVPDMVVPVQSAPGYQLMIELAPDERVETVAVGDSGAWQVTANKRGDRLFVRPIQMGITTNMIVVTDVRRYAFELAPLFQPQPDTAYAIRFRYPAPVPATGAAGDAEAAGRYKLGGDASLRPSGMHDDGVHTYIEWPEDRALPAIYAIDHNGQEALVNGMMRDGRMVIDSVQRRLVFRIDRHRATAVRLADRKR
jgi:type IV secretion system protein VirB9